MFIRTLELGCQQFIAHSPTPTPKKNPKKFVFLNHLKIPTHIVFLSTTPTLQTTPQFDYVCKRCEFWKISQLN
jgi:hypothetical protein